MRFAPLFALLSLALVAVVVPGCNGVDSGQEAQNLSIAATPVVEPQVPPMVDASYAGHGTTWPRKVTWNEFPQAAPCAPVAPAEAEGVPAVEAPAKNGLPAGELPPGGGAAAAGQPGAVPAPPPPPAGPGC